MNSESTDGFFFNIYPEVLSEQYKIILLKAQ